MAPAGVMSSANNDKVKLLVSLPKTAAGQEGRGDHPADRPRPRRPSPTGRSTCENPFNLIAGTDVIVRSGTPVPQGKVDVTVTGKVTVKF